MKIKARVTALGHMGDVEFETFPFAELLDDNKITEANKIVRKEVIKRIEDMQFKKSGTVDTLTHIIWEVVD